MSETFTGIFEVSRSTSSQNSDQDFFSNRNHFLKFGDEWIKTKRPNQDPRKHLKGLKMTKHLRSSLPLWLKPRRMRSEKFSEV